MSPKIRAVTPQATIGEGPIWEARHNCLLYVDIPEFRIHRYFPETGRHQTARVEKGDSGASVSFVLPSADDPEVLFIGHGRNLAAVKWSPSDPDESTIRAVPLASVDQGKTTRFNDGKCDPQGRIWAGTMGAELSPGNFDAKKGKLYRFSKDLKPVPTVKEVSISNGLTWSADRKTFYYIDSLEFRVEAFDYDDASGNISKRRTVVDFKKAATFDLDLPDGMEIDEDGNIWVASFSGSKISCIDPKNGAVVRTVEMPALNITSMCWGGPAYDVMYVTTARHDTPLEVLKAKPLAGAVFEITGLGCKGTPPFLATIDGDIVNKIKRDA